VGVATTSERIPHTLVEAIRYFSDEDAAFGFVKNLRWPDGQIACPRCGSHEYSFIATRKIWKCKGCRRQFSLKVGTIFEDSPLGWDRWLPAIWLIANSKNSISSHELARSLGVTQKTAWFMLHRIRDAMDTGTFTRLSGTVEVDETYIGGIAKNMHTKTRREKITGRGGANKTIVQGARERSEGTVHAAVLPRGRDFKANVTEWVEPGSSVYTDEHRAYEGLDRTFAHQAIVHGREYVRGEIHTNGIENFWALLKRAIKGTQVHIDPVHLHRYVTERTFAYNYRTDSDLTRMRRALSGTTGRRLTWADLTRQS
jgi:transposase-like protein